MSKIAIVLATSNEGKKREYELFFGRLPIAIKGFNEFKKIHVLEEKGASFAEIATNKARSVSRAFGVPALADDSGLVVEALNGAPGILSARYAGELADDYQNNLRLLAEMKGKINRNATFYCSIAIAKPDGEVLNYDGSCSGMILNEPEGEDGFGYDPVFYYPHLRRTFAQLTVEEKNRVSHRGQAMIRVVNDLERILAWLEER